MEKKNNLSSILLGIFVAATVLLTGFIVYDKLIIKEEKIECPKCEEKECPTTECPKCETGTCNCPTCTNNGEKISSLKEIKLTATNQTVKIGNTNVKVRLGTGDKDGYLAINDYFESDSTGNNFTVEYAYLTDKFMFFTRRGFASQKIVYAISAPHSEIVANNNSYNISDESFKIVNGYLHGTGSIPCGDSEKDPECRSKDLIIKYIDNTLIVTPYK